MTPAGWQTLFLLLTKLPSKCLLKPKDAADSPAPPLHTTEGTGVDMSAVKEPEKHGWPSSAAGQRANAL